MTTGTIQLAKLQLAHESEWVALDAQSKELLGAAETLPELMDNLDPKEREDGPILFKVPPTDVSLSPTGYEI